MQEQNVAGVMAAYIRELGVTHVFTYPGDPTIDFLEALRSESVQVLLGRREGTAAFMAEGYAQSTGSLGVCISTLGPGSTSLANGVAAATWDRVPMLAVSGQIESAREPYFTHQVVDHGALFRPLAKWTARVEPGAVGTIMRRAIRTAVADRPGAVHLSVSSDVFKARADGAAVTLPPLALAGAGIAASAPEPELLRVLTAARRPVILAGVNAVRPGVPAALATLAETAGAPVVVAPMAKGVIDEAHPYFAGVLDMACNAVVWDFLAGADLIVAVGFDAVELIKPWKLAVPVLHVDTLPNTDQIYEAAHEVTGDIASVLEWLAGSWRGQPRRPESDVAAFRTTLRNAYYAGRNPGALNPTDVVDAVQQAMPADTVVSCDVGSHKLLVGQGWQTRQPRGVLMTNGLSSMGFGVPAAMGARLARPDVPVAALVGDGGFAMVATELKLASELALPLVVVVFSDGSLNRIELKQMAVGYPSTATRMEPMDLQAMAAAVGCDGVRVEKVKTLAAALEDAGALTGPLLIEAVIDPAQYEAQF